MFSLRSDRFAAGNADEFVEITALSGGVEIADRTRHAVDYAEHPRVRAIANGLPDCLDLSLCLSSQIRGFLFMAGSTPDLPH